MILLHHAIPCILNVQNNNPGNDTEAKVTPEVPSTAPNSAPEVQPEPEPEPCNVYTT